MTNHRSTPSDSEVLSSLLRQVSGATHDGKPADVETLISRPMYEAFLRAAAKTSEEQDKAPDYHGNVFWTQTTVMDNWPLYYSWSLQKRKDLTLWTRFLATVCSLIGCLSPSLSVKLGLKIGHRFVKHMHVTQWNPETGKLQVTPVKG